MTDPVLVNDGDPDGDADSVTAAGPAGHGTVSHRRVSHLHPDADSFGADSFTYTISDGNGGTATAHGQHHRHAGQRRPRASPRARTRPSLEDAGATTVAGWATASAPDPPTRALRR